MTIPFCRETGTRRCPMSGCNGLPCARFEDDDESRWDLDLVTWKKENPTSKRADTYTPIVVDGIPALYVGSLTDKHDEYLAYGPDENGRYSLKKNDGWALFNVGIDSLVFNDH